MGRALTTEQFIALAVKKYPEDNYDFSKVVYVKSKNEVTIVCDIHGDFNIKPDDFLCHNMRCPHCGKDPEVGSDKCPPRRVCQKVWRNTIDYSEFVYQGYEDVSIFKCKEHGERYEQVYKHHAWGWMKCTACIAQKDGDDKFYQRLINVYPEIYAQIAVKHSETRRVCHGINKRDIRWVCRNNSSHEWYDKTYNVVLNNVKCPICSALRTLKEDFPEVYPHWDDERNAELGLDKETVLANDATVVYWICPRGGHKYQTSIIDRCVYRRKCLFCYAIKITDLNRFSLCEPYKASYWHPTKNEDTPADVMKCSTVLRWWQCPNGHEWRCSILAHTERANACVRCSETVHYSRVSIAWLESVMESEQIYIQHAENGGEYRVEQLPHRRYVDGYCASTNTIYQFHGDFWHGNPETQVMTDINKVAGKTFQKLHDITMRKDQQLRDAGYNLIVMWENTFVQSSGYKYKSRGLPNLPTVQQQTRAPPIIPTPQSIGAIYAPKTLAKRERLGGKKVRLAITP